MANETSSEKKFVVFYKKNARKGEQYIVLPAEKAARSWAEPVKSFATEKEAIEFANDGNYRIGIDN